MSSNFVQDVAAELKNRQVQQQIGRFARLFVVAYGVQLGFVGTGNLGRDAWISAGVGAAEVAYRQWAPTVPWARVLQVLHRKAAAPAPTAPPAATPPAAPGAASGPAK